MLRIFHTADIHIGMRFSNYPDSVRQKLVAERFEVLDRMVSMANDEHCQLFVIAGDLFEKTAVLSGDIDRVLRSMGKFDGDCIVILPGNHDYDNGESELWKKISEKRSDRMVLLNEARPYPLQPFGVDACIYPAPCDRKHSDKNNVGWIRNLNSMPEAKWKIGVAHGSLEGVSPDLDNRYYLMKQAELDSLNMDLWLLGHIHLPFPSQDMAGKGKLFISGTPEPDGMDCRHAGNAWIITLSDDGNVDGRMIETGKYRFYDETAVIRNEEDFRSLDKRYSGIIPERALVRLTLCGHLERSTFINRHELLKPLMDRFLYFTYADSSLMPRITHEEIQSQYTEGSLPSRFLQHLLETGDEMAVQEAYELIQEVREK